MGKKKSEDFLTQEEIDRMASLVAVGIGFARRNAIKILSDKLVEMIANDQHSLTRDELQALIEQVQKN